MHYPSATVACFDPTCDSLPRRRLDDTRLQVFLERLAELNVPAVLIAASTGHGHLRTPEELETFIEVAGEADLGETQKMALLRPEDDFRFNRGLLKRMRELGYDVVFFRPGTNLDPAASDDEVVENLAPLIETAAEEAFRIGVYSIPDVSGLPLTPAAVAELTKRPGGDSIVAVKVTEADYDNSTHRFLDHPELTHLQIVQGWDPHIARALQEGAGRCGVTSGPMSFAVHQYQHILERASHGEWEEVHRAQAAVTKLFQAMQDDPRKFADLQRAKYIMGLGHPITGEVTEEQVQRVLEALRSLERIEDRQRLARSLDLMGEGPYHAELHELATD